jgi:gluconokinase
MARRASVRACTIGLDLGTTTLKTVAFDDATSQPIARAAATTSLRDASDHEIAVGAVRAEQDPHAVADAATNLLAQTATQAGVLGYRVARVGVSAAMHSIIALGEDERPLLPALLWMDGRAEAEAQALWQTPAGRALYTRTGTPISAMTPLSKLLWMRAQRPDVFAAATRYVSLKEWIWRRWLDAWEVDASIASATGLYNLRENDWDGEALRLVGIRPTQLSTLVPTTTLRAGLREERLLAAGLSAQTPFVIGASDGVLANLGLGAVPDGGSTTSDAMALTIGTSLALRAGSVRPLTDPATRAFCYVLDQGRYVVGAASNSGGNVLEWLGGLLRSGASAASPAQRLDALLAQAEILESGDLLCLPYLTGERAPLWSARARAAFIGLDTRHTPAHLLRAACEGIVYNAHWIASGLFALVGRPREALASGRVLEIPWIRQLVADVFDLPVRISGAADASAWGAAMLARIATGARTWEQTLLDATQAERREASAVVYPDPARTAHHHERARRFRLLAETLNVG